MYMSSDMEYEVVWDGTHQGSDADLLIAKPQHIPARLPSTRLFEQPQRDTDALPAGRQHLIYMRGSTRVERNGKKIDFYCLECGQLFHAASPSQAKRNGGRKFCSHKCRGLWQLRQSALHPVPLCVAKSRARRRLRKLIPHVKPCEVCDTTERVERHHIDHNPLNNELTNIAFLCSAHHAQHHATEREQQPF